MFLVTGATGFIGSHLVEHLVAAGAAVRCLVRRTSSLQYLPAGRIELAYGDAVTGEELREAVRGVDTVFHLAGVTKAHSSAGYYMGNVRATENLVRACEGVERLVHVSSLAAVGPAMDGSPVEEDAPPRPVSHYGKSKLQSEQVVRESTLAARAVIVRPPVVYGPRDTDVFHVFRAAARGFILQIGRAERSFSLIYVKDLAEGLLAAAQNAAAAGKIYFLANPEPVSWSEFGSMAAGLVGRQARTLRLPVWAAYAAGCLAEVNARLRRKPGILSRDKIAEARCPAWVCSTSRARRELGFCARTPLREGMAETLSWYREMGWIKA